MTSAAPLALRLDPRDDVAVALVDLTPGQLLGELGVTVQEPVAKGHKIALRNLATGETVRKYGQTIGAATGVITAGAHVHVHNVGFVASVREAVAPLGDNPSAAPLDAHFAGYLREDGNVGTRNFLGVLTSVNCSATVARKIAAYFDEERIADFSQVDGVAAFTHTTGCGTPMTGDGVDNLQRTVAGYAAHANFAAVVVIGLGCEVNQIERLFSAYGLERSDRLHAFTIQDVGGTAKAIEHGKGLVRELLVDANRARRSPQSARHLCVGLQCGGSDAWSGVTANPSLGAAADRIVRAGGTAILSETPEIYGAEHLLLARARSAHTQRKLIERLEWWEDYVQRNGASLDNNPSPGNKAGGLTTILEKSLGAVAKSGSSPLADVVRYGEKIATPGFVFMDTPGYDPCSATGQIAGGANLVAFTTGRGSVFGSKPAPCLKLASNSAMAARMDDDIDIDCGPVLEGVSIDEMGERIFARMLSAASGEKTKSEVLGHGDEEFVPWQVGAYV